MTIPTSTQPAPASTVDMGAFFTVSRDTEPAASSASPAPSAASFAVACGDSNVALPIVPGHVASFLEPTPAVDWNTRVLQGLDTIIPPVATPTPPVAASTAPSVPSESHLRRLERRQLTNPYSKISTRQEGLHAAQQRFHDLRQENPKMAKRMIRADEEFKHVRKCDDMDWDVNCACLDEAIEHRKQRKVADAWHEHIFEERKGKTWEEWRHLDQDVAKGQEAKKEREALFFASCAEGTMEKTIEKWEMGKENRRMREMGKQRKWEKQENGRMREGGRGRTTGKGRRTTGREEDNRTGGGQQDGRRTTGREEDNRTGGGQQDGRRTTGREEDNRMGGGGTEHQTQQ
ncbi:uncharacterized protein EDB93DRAFT_1107224 [Suillus bovinus]|uniref:uncharacterized protein n=1 Tax=Suillus bovinus TaxID=48563 RepID=UPI001B86E1A9|nr:uncharacterized protein EDB93DRAFT_1107224 [Suillus bovinus]KAG2134891.1 hypothetical protein EDB93DRAFT_1107224 [Suillus bovinus]